MSYIYSENLDGSTDVSVLFDGESRNLMRNEDNEIVSASKKAEKAIQEFIDRGKTE